MSNVIFTINSHPDAVGDPETEYSSVTTDEWEVRANTDSLVGSIAELGYATDGSDDIILRRTDSLVFAPRDDIEAVACMLDVQQMARMRVIGGHASAQFIPGQPESEVNGQRVEHLLESGHIRAVFVHDFLPDRIHYSETDLDGALVDDLAWSLGEEPDARLISQANDLLDDMEAVLNEPEEKEGVIYCPAS